MLAHARSASISSCIIVLSGMVSLQHVEQIAHRQRAVLVERFVEAGDHGLLDLGAREPVRGHGQGVEVELRRVAVAFGQVDAPDVGAFAGVGQVDEEDLVEAALAHQLGRQLADVVGRGDDEDRRLLLLQPGDEAAEDAGRRAGVADVAGADAGEALLDLVDPQHHRRDALGGPDGACAGSPRWSRPGEAKRRPTSRRSRGSCHELATALATRLLPQPCTPTSRMPLGSGRPKARASSPKARTRLRSHSLSVVQAADVGQPLVAGVELEQPALADDLLLLGRDAFDGVAVQPAVGLDDGLGDGVGGLADGQAEAGLHQPLALAAIQVDVDVALALIGP